jgi:RNA polymerase sigma-70 factor (ECF subfamily)
VVIHRHEHDRDLVRRVLRGDADAFDLLVDEYYPRLYRFAFSRLGSDADAAQDVVQSCFTKLLPKLAQYRGEAALFTWMCSFCRFEIAAHWRRARRSPEVELRDEAPDVRAALESLSASDGGIEAALEREEVGRLVRRTLDYLPLRYCHALEWKYLQGRSVREIAQRMGISPKAAESLLTRARQAFRDGFVTVSGG